MSARTGLAWDERFMWHDAGRWAGIVPHGGLVQPGLTFEHPETKRRLKNLLDASGLTRRLGAIEARAATRAELERFHTPGYIDRIARESAELGGEGGEATPFGRGSYEIACRAAGATIEAADQVARGRFENAYVLARPPGHHAEPDRGRGFCLFGNIVIGIRALRAVHQVERVAVVDWDVHHGNGTQLAFYDDPSVLTISIHQDRNYPLETGALAERGRGPGEGFNRNLPLAPGAGHGSYLHAIEALVVPALERFRPEIVFVACGFDASLYDPLGRMMCTSETYREMTRRVGEAARQLCGGRLVCCHEGGYSESYVPPCGLAVIEELSGERTKYRDLVPLLAEQMPGHALRPEDAAAVATGVEGIAKLR